MPVAAWKLRIARVVAVASFAPVTTACTDILGVDFDGAQVTGASSGPHEGAGGSGGTGGAGGSGGPAHDPALWARWLGSPDFVDYGHAVVFDQAGNVYVAGNFGGSHDLGCTPKETPSMHDLFVAKLDASGVCLWMTVSGGGLVGEMALDPDGDVVVAGAFAGDIDFGGGQIAWPGGEQIFLARFDGESGEYVDAWSFGTAESEYASGLAIGPDGSMYLSGHYKGATSFGTGSATEMPGSNGTGDAFVLKVDSRGIPVWAKGFPGYGGEDALTTLRVTADGTGLIAGGRFSGLVTFGEQSLASHGGFDALVLRFATATGSVDWAWSMGDLGEDQVFSLAIRDDLVFVTGWFHGYEVDFGNDFDLAADGDDADAFLAELHVDNGFTNWAARFGGPRTDGGFAVAIAPDGDVVLTGEFRDEAGFADKTLVAEGDQDVFVLRLPASHFEWEHARWARRYGTSGIIVQPSEERGRGIAVGPDGSVAVVGSFAETATFGTTSITSLGLNDAFVALLPP